MPKMNAARIRVAKPKEPNNNATRQKIARNPEEKEGDKRKHDNEFRDPKQAHNNSHQQLNKNSCLLHNISTYIHIYVDMSDKLSGKNCVWNGVVRTCCAAARNSFKLIGNMKQNSVDDHRCERAITGVEWPSPA